MRKTSFSAAAALAASVALAQVEASSSLFFLDIDPARYNGPPAQRLALQLGDQPRAIALNSQDEICVQLRRAPADGAVISALVRALRPEPHAVVEVKVAGPGISPGTYRSTPWGMLLRAVADEGGAPEPIKALDTSGSPVCSL